MRQPCGGTSGGERASALWGTGKGKDGSRSRKLTTIALAALAFAIPSTGLAGSGNSGSGSASSGSGSGKAFIPKSLLDKAKKSENAPFRVIIQMKAGKSAKAAGDAARASGGKVHRELKSVRGVAATLSGRAVEALSRNPNVLAITIDAPVRATLLATAPLNVLPPTVSGPTQDGQALSASSGTWDGTTPMSFGYQWRRCDALGSACSDIAGATGAGYALGSADVGSTLRVAVTASNEAGSASAVSPATLVVLAAPPANSTPPSVSGTATSGETLSAAVGSWSGSAPLAYAYQWQRCDSAGLCVDVLGANGATYALASADLGYALKVVVTASNGAGSASAASAATAAVAAPAVTAPSNGSAPSISGTPADGQTLVASEGSWTGTTPIAYAYRWQRCDPTGALCSDVSGATGANYVLGAADVGSTIRLAVSASNEAGSAQAVSAATGVVLGLLPANSALPAVSGEAIEGATLTASGGTWAGTTPIALSYQWQRSDSLGAFADITGATGESYVLGSADVGFAVRVVVSASNVAGKASATSAATATVKAQVTYAPPPQNAEMWRRSTQVDMLWSQLDPYTGAVLGPAPQAPAIAIVDSGVDASRVEDFGGRVVASVNLASLAPDATGDGQGHGTMVAGVAAGQSAKYPGVAQNAPIVSVRVSDDKGMSMSSDVIAAADWILANKDAYNIRVANFSLKGSVETSYRFDPLNKAVQALWLNGVVVVAAAGNHGASDGSAVSMSYAPGNDPFVITVGASDERQSEDPLDNGRPSWSGHGVNMDGFHKPEVSAPGRYMIMPIPASSTIARDFAQRMVEPGYIWMSGTSFSTPIVSGIAAQLLALHPAWTPDQVKGALMLTANYLGGPGFAAGVGQVDALWAAYGLGDYAPDANENYGPFIKTDSVTGQRFFDEASWAEYVKAAASWSSASWTSASWSSASWSSASWSSASWSSASWTSSVDTQMSSQVTENESSSLE